MSHVPDSTSPRLLAQLDILQQMGYLLRIVFLKGTPDLDCLSRYSRLKEQCISLTLNRTKIPLAVFTLLLLMIIAPIKSLRAFGAMLKMLCVFKDRKQVIKNYLQAGILVNQHVIDKEISHLHSHCEPVAARTTYLASLLTGLNSSYLTLSGEIFEPIFEKLKPALEHSSFIFTLSVYEQRVLLENMFNDVEVLPNMFCAFNGIDLERFGFVRSTCLPEEPYNFFTATHLSDKKGLDLIFYALRELKDQGMKFSYQIVGDGPVRDNLEELAKDLDLQEEISFKGIKPRYEIPKFLSKADLYLLAPRILENGEQDSIPLGAEEAMAVGVPVVATECGAICELIETEETGLLAKPDDKFAFAAACKRLLTDQELRAQVILKARLKIEGGYNIHKQAEIFSDYITTHEIPL
jgi:glycosyltransferase involved in cell wall biosynthesis